MIFVYFSKTGPLLNLPVCHVYVKERVVVVRNRDVH